MQKDRSKMLMRKKKLNQLKELLRKRNLDDTFDMRLNQCSTMFIKIFAIC